MLTRDKQVVRFKHLDIWPGRCACFPLNCSRHVCHKCVIVVSVWLSSVELEWTTRVPRNSSEAAAAQDQVEHLRLFRREIPACLVLKRERAFSDSAKKEQKLRKHRRQSSNRSRRPPRHAGCAFAVGSTTPGIHEQGERQ